MLQGRKGPDHHSSHHCPRAAVLGHIAMSGLMAWLISVTPAHAQLATQHIKGVVGLKGGSPPPPGTYVIAPLFYIYDTDVRSNGTVCCLDL